MQGYGFLSMTTSSLGIARTIFMASRLQGFKASWLHGFMAYSDAAFANLGVFGVALGLSRKDAHSRRTCVNWCCDLETKRSNLQGHMTARQAVHEWHRCWA